MPFEVENECLKFNSIKYAKAFGRENPFTGQHVELLIEINELNNYQDIKNNLNIHLKRVLPRYMMPARITFKKINVSHRFKKL